MPKWIWADIQIYTNRGEVSVCIRSEDQPMFTRQKVILYLYLGQYELSDPDTKKEWIWGEYRVNMSEYGTTWRCHIST